MTKNQFSDEIVIRFALTKGQGDLPSKEELSEGEIECPATICSFNLDLDYGKFDEDLDPIGLTEITILYDGVSEYGTLDEKGKVETHGVYWDESQDELVGYPAPVIKFKFKEPVDKEIFLSLVNFSCVNICSEIQAENDVAGFFFEDYAGWAQIIEGKKLKEYIEFLKDVDVYYERTYKYIEDEFSYPFSPSYF